MAADRRFLVLVMGAGAVGCWLGGCLRAAGAQVIFIGRSRVLDALRTRGLTVTDLDGRHEHLPPATLALADEVPPIAPSLVLLTVRSGATREAARALTRLPALTPVVSMQNGVSNARIAQAVAPQLTLLPGMVPFSIAEVAPGRYHRGSGGMLAAQGHPALREALPLFERARLPLKLHADLSPVLWGKLLLNLNHPVNALSGLPLREELLDAGYRRCLAALQSEALEVLHAAAIEPAQIGAVPPPRLPLLLKLPTPLFRLLAQRTLRLDEQARSSMADDVARGRPTEIDALCGEVVRLAESLGRQAPCNARIVELLAAPKPPRLSARALRAELAAASARRPA